MTSPRSTDPGREGRRDDHGPHDQRQEQQRRSRFREGLAETAGAEAGHARTSIPPCLRPGSPADGPAKKRSVVSGTGSRRTRDACVTPARRASERKTAPSAHSAQPHVSAPRVPIRRKAGLTRPHPQDDSPQDAQPNGAAFPGHWRSCICRQQGGVDAETQELVDGNPRPGAAGSARCNAVIPREVFYSNAREERAPPSQTSAWSGPAAGIEE
jgi:hypothetical protein